MSEVEVQEVSNEAVSSEMEQTEVLEQQEVQSVDYESEARNLGWKPVAEFEGNPKYHVSAEEYVARGRPTHKQIQLQQERIDSMEALLTEHAKQFQVNEQRVHERVREELLKKRQVAVESNDMQKYDAVTKEIEDLRAPMLNSEMIPQQTAPQTSDVVQNYLVEHSWASTPKTPEEFLMQEDLFKFDNAFKASNPNSSDAELVKFVHDVISKKYPHKFKSVDVNQSPVVAGVKTAIPPPSKDLPHPEWEKMTSSQQHYALEFQRLGTCTVDKYVNQLKDNGDLK